MQVVRSVSENFHDKRILSNMIMHTDLNDLNLINELSKGKIDLTYGR